EVGAERLVQAPGRVLVAEEAKPRDDAMPERAAEDDVALFRVEVHELRGAVPRLPRARGVRRDEAERQDASSRSAGDEVEDRPDRAAATTLDLLQQRCRDQTSDPAAVDGEDAERPSADRRHCPLEDDDAGGRRLPTRGRETPEVPETRTALWVPSLPRCNGTSVGPTIARPAPDRWPGCRERKAFVSRTT